MKKMKKKEEEPQKPTTGQKAILDLGYGPLSMDYDIEDPKGVWEKVRKGEVTEIYLGDGIGSTFVKTPYANKGDKKKEHEEWAQFMEGFLGHDAPDRKKSPDRKKPPSLTGTVNGSKNLNKSKMPTDKGNETEDANFSAFFDGFSTEEERRRKRRLR